MFVVFIKLIESSELETRVTMAGFLWPFLGGIDLRVVIYGTCRPGRESRLHL